MADDDGVSKLARLVAGGKLPTNEEAAALEQQDAEAVEEIDGLLKYAASRCDNDIFEMQALIEAGAEELRDQIRQMVDGDDG